jgi:hypothetical protein
MQWNVAVFRITLIARDALTKMMLLKQDAGQKTEMLMCSTILENYDIFSTTWFG